MASLALCMIVKNEEKYLPYALASVYKYCDEIIIVDTGSTDRTIEIAEGFGAYVIRAPWVNDFAKVRNISQSCAKSDWILWLDADEVFSEAGIKKIKNQLINDANADFFLMPRVNFWKDFNHAFCYPDSQYKIYRNKIGMIWRSEIHEFVFDKDNPDHRARLKHTDVHIYHYAYMKTPEEVKKKMALYIKIENPEMGDNHINECSTEHSFFLNNSGQEVQPYHGQLPEIFNELDSDDNGVRYKGGEAIITYDKNRQVNEVKQIATSAPSYQPAQNRAHVDGMCSIVIATYNKLEYLEPCIRDIYNSTQVPFELIVVDNGSPQENIMNFLIPFSQEHDNFSYVHSDENKGFAGGYNMGVEKARGEYICVLNNDTLVTEGWLSKMIGHLKNNPNMAMMAPVSNNIHGEHQMITSPHEGAEFGAYIAKVNEMIDNGGERCLSSSWLTGCCLVFHRSLLDELAAIPSPKRNGILFCEDFRIGMGEDTDLDFYVQHRLKRQLGVARDTFIWHHGQKSLEDVAVDWRELQQENDAVLRKRWPEIFPNG